jgi:hypothetical protein
MDFHNVMSPSGLELNAVIVVMLVFALLNAVFLGLLG